jgi:hypothetical protein
LPEECEFATFEVSENQDNVLNIININESETNQEFSIQAKSMGIISKRYSINALVNPVNRKTPVTQEEQNPVYTTFINNKLLTDIEEYMSTSNFNITPLETINENSFLTEEEKYHQLFEEMLKKDIKLVDHIAINNEIDSLIETQNARV